MRTGNPLLICLSVCMLPISLGCLYGLGVRTVATAPIASSEQDASAKRFESIKDMAVVYVYRDISSGLDTKMNILVDQKAIGGTTLKTFMRLELPPGNHEIIGRTEADSILALQVAAGRIYYIQQRPRIGWKYERCKLRLVDENIGREGVMKCRLVCQDIDK